MKKYFKTFCLHVTVLAVTLCTPALHAQSCKGILTKAGNMKLSGTSTMHEWTMMGTFQVDGDFKMAEGTGQLESLNKLSFLLPVENLKSDKKRLDETAYKALKTEEHKDILFTMTSATIKEVNNNKYAITALGNLTIAGVTKPITMNVTWIRNHDNTITCTGIQKLKMTDFEVKPPSFLGVMKTGDEIALDFSFQFKSQYPFTL